MDQVINANIPKPSPAITTSSSITTAVPSAPVGSSRPAKPAQETFNLIDIDDDDDDDFQADVRSTRSRPAPPQPRGAAISRQQMDIDDDMDFAVIDDDEEEALREMEMEMEMAAKSTPVVEPDPEPEIFDIPDDSLNAYELDDWDDILIMDDEDEDEAIFQQTPHRAKTQASTVSNTSNTIADTIDLVSDIDDDVLFADMEDTPRKPPPEEEIARFGHLLG
ncbi:hypothetical protein FBU59_007139 [Linderina macrospora]|uniref:Uncharacterized protein n=1 Tax=Linderina macrospora TaxID=4868 RepID=A0ACC1IXY6_9FUNG|nr:hypothetical protein FBU59_007139 [Linderina macrospora]